MILPLSSVTPDTHALPALYFPVRRRRSHAAGGVNTAIGRAAREEDSIALSPAAARILEQEDRLKEMLA